MASLEENMAEILEQKKILYAINVENADPITQYIVSVQKQVLETFIAVMDLEKRVRILEDK